MCNARHTYNATKRCTACRDRRVLQGRPEEIGLGGLVAPCLGDCVRRNTYVDRCDVCDVIYAIQHMCMYMWARMYRTHSGKASIQVNGVYCFLLFGFRNRWRNKPVRSWLHRCNNLQCDGCWSVLMYGSRWMYDTTTHMCGRLAHSLLG